MSTGCTMGLVIAAWSLTLTPTNPSSPSPVQLCPWGLSEMEEKRKQELFPFQGEIWEKKGFCGFPSVTPAGLEGSQELRALFITGIKVFRNPTGSRAEQRPHHAGTRATLTWDLSETETTPLNNNKNLQKNSSNLH